MPRAPLALTTSLAALGLLLASACGLGTVGAGSALDECDATGLVVSATPPGQVGDTGFLAIGLYNCGAATLTLDSHPSVEILDGDLVVGREGNVAESLLVDPGATLTATLTWVIPDADVIVEVDHLLVHALPEHVGFDVALAAAFDVVAGDELHVGAWQSSGVAPTPEPEPEPVEPETPPVSEEEEADCPDEGYLMSMPGEPNAAMGLRVAAIKLFNCGDEAVEVNGYPVVTVLAQGSATDVEVVHGTGQINDPGPVLIMVAPGETVSATLEWRNTVESADEYAVLRATALEVAYTEGAPFQVVKPGFVFDLGTTRSMGITAWR